jgi:SPW repeat
MTNKDHISQVTLASGINVLLGVWVIISPWFYGYAAGPAPASVALNNVIVGMLIVICAALRSFSPDRRVSLSGINIVLGIWTLISPWIYGYGVDGALFGTNIIAGIAVIALAIWSGGVTYVDRSHQRHA